MTPSSRDSAPATTAAAASPIECPITAPGATPWAFMAAASATWTAKRVGWMRSMPDTCSAASMASVTEKPDCARTSGSISATVAANTGSEAISSRPIAAHCEPWPENTHTGPRSSWPTAGGWGESPAAMSRSSSTNSAGVPAIAAVRTVRNPRRQDSVCARSVSATSGSAVCSHSASRPALRRSSSAEVEDSGKTRSRAAGAQAAGSAASGPGACSSTACTLVPDMP